MAAIRVSEVIDDCRLEHYRARMQRGRRRKAACRAHRNPCREARCRRCDSSGPPRRCSGSSQRLADRGHPQRSLFWALQFPLIGLALRDARLGLSAARPWGHSCGHGWRHIATGRRLALATRVLAGLALISVCVIGVGRAASNLRRCLDTDAILDAHCAPLLAIDWTRSGCPVGYLAARPTASARRG